MENNTLTVLKQSELLGHQFTVYGTADSPLFLAKEVAEVINHSKTDVMVNTVDDDEKVKVNNVYVDGRTGGNGVWFLTEDGLYEVLMQSRKPIAKQFKKGVKAILKEIRKTGGYIAASDNDTPEVIMARALMVADETMKRQKAIIQAKDEQINAQREEINSLAPMADYTKEVLQSDSTYTLTQVSKDLGFRSVYTFQDWAKGKGILYKQSGQWLPTAKYSGKGYFTTRTAKYVKNNNEIGSSISTVVTESGRLFLHYVKDNKD